MQARRFFFVALIFSLMMIISACSDGVNNPFEPQDKLETNSLLLKSGDSSTAGAGELVPESCHHGNEDRSGPKPLDHVCSGDE